LGADAGRADAAGPGGLIDDDVAFVAPWGFDVTQIDAPVLLVQGGEDRIVPPAHAHWLMRHCRRPELWFRPHDGHVSILNACPLAMDWLKAHSEGP
jgi:pimeloyl-ACP methyl ester carboxylesterase